MSEIIKPAAIYLYTRGNELHPGMVQNRIRFIEKSVKDHGLNVGRIYLDHSRNRYQQSELDIFLSESTLYSMLFIHDFKQLSQTTTKCIKTIQNLSRSGVSTYSLKDGLYIPSSVPFSKELKIATYYNCSVVKTKNHEPIIQVQNEIFRLFVQNKTSWDILDQYADNSERQNKGEQNQLDELIQKRDNYDLILVSSLNDIHERTSTFSNLRNCLEKDIYSMNDGYLEFRKGLS